MKFSDPRKIIIEEIKEEEKVEHDIEYLLNNFTHLINFLNREFLTFGKLMKIEEEKRTLARELQEIERRLRMFLTQIHEFEEFLRKGNWNISLRELGILNSFESFLKRFVNVAIERVEKLCEEEKRILDEMKQEINKELQELKTIIKAERGELHNLSELEKLIEKEKSIYTQLPGTLLKGNLFR